MSELNVRQSIYINQPVEAIFPYVSDLENLVDWSSIVISARRSDAEAIQVGTTVRSTVHFLGRWFDITFEVVEYESGRSLVIKSISGAVSCYIDYQFEPVADGGTIVSQESGFHLIDGVIELAEPVITSAVRRQLEYDLLTLKDILEARTLMCEAAE